MNKEQKRQINQFLQSGLSNCQNHDIPINEKYALSVREAASYFNIGKKKSADWRMRISEISPFAAETVI